MLRNNHNRFMSFIVVAGLMVLMGHGSAAVTAPVIEKLVINPSTTDIPVKADQIAIAAKASGKNLTFAWKLDGPGSLEEPTTEPVVYYIPPETIEQEKNLATVSVTIRDDQGQEATAGVVFTIIGVEAEIQPSHKGDLAKPLTGRVIINEQSKIVKGLNTLFTTELKDGDAIRIGEEIPKIGENVFVVSSIKDDEELELDTVHPTGVDEVTPARIFTDQELFVVANGADVGKFVIDKSGNVGIGTTSPNTELDVNGWVSMKGRRGYYASGTVPGDGQWHDILSHLNHHVGFEVIADIRRSGLHGLLHAIAIKTYMGDGESGGLTKTQAYYRNPNGRIDIRWTGTTYDYNLQLRTLMDYGNGIKIKYYVTQLW